MGDFMENHDQGGQRRSTMRLQSSPEGLQLRLPRLLKLGSASARIVLVLATLLALALGAARFGFHMRGMALDLTFILVTLGVLALAVREWSWLVKQSAQSHHDD